MCVGHKRNKQTGDIRRDLITDWNLLEYFVGAKSDDMNHAPHRSQNNRQRERSNCHPKHSPSQSPAFMDSDNLCLRPKFNHHITHSRPHILQNGPPPDTERGRGTCLTVVPAQCTSLYTRHQNITIIMMTMMMMVEENSARHNNIIKSIRTVMPAIVAHRNKYSPFLRTARKEFSGIQ